MIEGIVTRLSQAAAWCGGVLHGADLTFHGVTSDSRAVRPGNLFIALQGPNHDGHDHVGAALAAGAVAALVQRPCGGASELQVADSRLALGRLGAAWRRHLGTPLVAVTGSNGKTTVKEMVAAILATRGPVLATQGNLNNDLGVPLTLLRLTPEHHFAVIEMGANHPGEIAYLTSLATPDVGVITGVGPAHLEGFGSLRGVAEAKGELYIGLGEGAIAVVNRDEPFAELWLDHLGRRRTLGFSVAGEAAVHAAWVGEGETVTLHYGSATFAFTPPLPGRHNLSNALAAAACAFALGVPGAAVVEGLTHLAPVRGRLQQRRADGGARVLDDSYNANPGSMFAAIEVLAARPGRRLLAIGDMAELGADARRLHAEVGERARQAGIDALYAIGPMSLAAVEAYGDGARHFEDMAPLVERLAAEMNDANTTLLIKGSRSARMERLVDALCREGKQ